MKKILLLLIISCLVNAAPGWAKSHHGVVTIEVDLTAQEPGKETKLWLPYAVSDGEQECAQ